MKDKIEFRLYKAIEEGIIRVEKFKVVNASEVTYARYNNNQENISSQSFPCENIPSSYSSTSLISSSTSCFYNPCDASISYWNKKNKLIQDENEEKKEGKKKGKTRRRFLLRLW